MGLLLGTILYPSICQDNQNRRKYIIWGLRCAALALAIVAFVLTTKNFCESSCINLRSSLNDLDTVDPVCYFRRTIHS